MQELRDCRESFEQIRRRSEELCQTLETEDYVIQAMSDVSPPKWHLAHTTWFFETFLLVGYLPNYEPVCPEYSYLFNSYYDAIGPQWNRPSRGYLSRPTVQEVMDYRRRVDEVIRTMFCETGWNDCRELLDLMVLGLNHEQQHQELLLTDIKYNFSINPCKPVYRRMSEVQREPDDEQLHWIEFPAGIHPVGHGAGKFCFDNELPRHEVLIRDFKLAKRLTTCAEYLEFIEDGGYRSPQLWLSDGWERVCSEEWKAPLYWEEIDGSWHLFTLSGLREVKPAEPVCHVSQFEADAFATWAGKRLPTEFEWEVAAETSQSSLEKGNFADEGVFHPNPAVKTASTELSQMFGDLWEWSGSAYLPYPGFRPGPGAIGEYNGKFMSGQIVLRGGSTGTPRNHIRTSYRNFFQPEKRWQFSGIRLADGV